MFSNPWTTSERLPDRNTSDIPQCLVLSCSGRAEQVWTEPTVTTNHRLVSWPVCREHYLHLIAGDPWESASGGPRSFRRWLLMGDQLDTLPRPRPGQRPRLALTPERAIGVLSQNETARDLCMVLNCGLPAQHTWTTKTAWRAWTVDWLACASHHAKLQADLDWVLVHGQPPDWRRWILMGDDVGKQAADVHDQPAAPAGRPPEPSDWSNHGQPHQHITISWGGLVPAWGGLLPPTAS